MTSIPNVLSENSKKIWKSLVPSQAKTKSRQTLIQVALEALDRADMARNIIDAEGLLVSANEGGLTHAHPLLKVEKDSRALFAKIWMQIGFGFDPAIY